MGLGGWFRLASTNNNNYCWGCCCCDLWLVVEEFKGDRWRMNCVVIVGDDWGWLGGGEVVMGSDEDEDWWGLMGFGWFGSIFGPILRSQPFPSISNKSSLVTPNTYLHIQTPRIMVGMVDCDRYGRQRKRRDWRLNPPLRLASDCRIGPIVVHMLDQSIYMVLLKSMRGKLVSIGPESSEQTRQVTSKNPNSTTSSLHWR